MRRLSFSIALMLILVLALSSGCQTGPRIYHVKGSVTYKGEPLPSGTIFFDPDSGKQNDGPQGYAFIKDGVYDTAAKGGQGIVGKAYLVRIHGFDGKPAEELPQGRVLFTDFQQAVEFPLQDTIQDFKVK